MKLPTTKGELLNSGACSQLNVLTLTHHSEKLPILVLMINSFIHLNMSQHFFKNQRLAGQFYQVLAYFADLGPQARLYLLKNKTVGRLLDLFFHDVQGNRASPQTSEKFRSLTLEGLPLFHLEKELYMESNLEKSDAKISPAERRAALQDATQPSMFLLYTVARLARSCCFVKDSPVSHGANDSLIFVLDSDEIAMIINHENEIIWRQCEQKLPRNAIADMYAHISFENKEFSLQFLPTILKGLLNATFDKMKVYERPLLKQLLIRDRFQAERTQKALGSLHEIMKQNTQYYKEMDSIIDIVYKIVQRSAVAVEVINKNPNFIRFIEQWCKENPHIPLNQAKTKILKQGIISWSSFKPNAINQQTIDKIATYQKDRLLKLGALLSKDVATAEAAYDSDDDMYHHSFAVKERVDFVDNFGNCYTGSVDVALDEMVKCVSDVTQANPKPVVQYIGTETDQLAPPLTITASEKRKMHSFYLNLLKAIKPEEQ